MTAPSTDQPDQVAQLRAQLVQLAHAVAGLHTSVRYTVDSIDSIETRVGAVETTRAGAPPGRPAQARLDPATMRWGALDTDAEALAWHQLVRWVGWLVDRYQIHNDLAGCWYRHPPMVEEVTALYLAWQTAYIGNGPWDAPIRWHEELNRARSRWREWDDETKCRLNGQHTKSEVVAWPGDWTAAALKHGPHANPRTGGETQ